MVVDSVGRALKPVSPSVPATLIAYRGIDLWWVQGHCTRSSCLPTLASRQGPVNLGCGWAWAGISVFREPYQGCSKAYPVSNYMWVGGIGWDATQIREASIRSFTDCAPTSGLRTETA